MSTGCGRLGRPTRAIVFRRSRSHHAPWFRHARSIVTLNALWTVFASSVALGIAVSAFLVSSSGAFGATSQIDHQSSQGTQYAASKASPQVRILVDLNNINIHPRQLVYDNSRDGLWFWTSTQDRGVRFDNRLWLYSISTGKLENWPIYSGDWSSQLHAGLALAPNGHVWIGWHHNLIDFNPNSHSWNRFQLPPHEQYPLSQAVLGDIPRDLGISDIAVDPIGSVWIAQYAELSLLSFSPDTGAFAEFPLPSNAGDPAKLAIAPDGHLFFTVNFSADHPGWAAEKVGEFDTSTHEMRVYNHDAQAISVDRRGDVYTAFYGGVGWPENGVSRLSAAERANALTAGRVASWTLMKSTFPVDDSALVTDSSDRLWMGSAASPTIAALTPSSGQIVAFTYSAASIVNGVASGGPYGTAPRAPSQAAVYLSHIVAMATDVRGHLYYIRAGSDRIETVAA